MTLGAQVTDVSGALTWLLSEVFNVWPTMLNANVVRHKAVINDRAHKFLKKMFAWGNLINLYTPVEI